MNYFNYFTEIEDRFQQRRGSLLMLSTLDWALIETWREAGVPLEAVLRGIDAAFDNYDKQRPRLGGRPQRKVNGLAWCAQAVMEAVKQSREAAIGAAPTADSEAPRESGFEAARIARYLDRNAGQLDATAARLSLPAVAETAVRLRELAVAYTVPSNLLSFSGRRISAATVTLALQNVALWTRYQGPDPEVVSNPSGVGGAFFREDFLTLPNPKRTSLRFDFTF